MTTWAEHVRSQEKILAEPKGPTVCSCGAPGGSAHNHNTGEVVSARICSTCREGRHSRCRRVKQVCACAERGHRAG